MKKKSEQNPGIYCIINKVNDKKYVGQTYCLEKRMYEHKRKSRSCPAIHAAIEKYGIDNFDFEIIEKCEIEFLDEREKYWIKELHSHISEWGYNISWGGNTPQLGRKHTPEEILKMIKSSPRLSGSMAPNWGRQFSEEHKRKIQENHKDNRGEKHPSYGKKKSEESKRKYKENRVYYKGDKNPLYGAKQSPDVIEKRVSGNRAKKRLGETTSKYVGVWLNKDKRWVATICGKYLGVFATDVEAALAVNEFLLEEYGWKMNDRLNKITQEEIENNWNLFADEDSGDLS